MATKKKTPQPDVKLISVKEAVSLWRDHRGPIAPNTITKWCRLGLIAGVVLDKSGMHARWLIPDKTLLAFDPPKDGWRKGRPRKGLASNSATQVDPNARRKAVEIDGVTYDSMKLAAHALGISPSGLSKRISRAKVAAE